MFSNKVKCGECGAWYGAKTWHSKDKYRREIYRCNNKYKTKGQTCKSPHLTEGEIKNIFIKALNTLTKVKKNIIKEIDIFIDTLCATKDLEIEAEKLETALEEIISDMDSLIKENAKPAQNQENYLISENQMR